MSNRTSLTAAPDSRSYRLGQLLSQIFHPILINTLCFLIVGLLAVTPWQTGLLWAAVCLALQIVPGVLFFGYRRRQGAYSDPDVSVRQQRNELYVFGLVTLGVGLAVVWLAQAPAPIVALSLAALLIIIINGLVNLAWKISGHATSIGTLATLATLYVPALGVALWGCALAVGWARVRTGNHTPAQVAAGLAVAAAVIWGVFRLMVY